MKNTMQRFLSIPSAAILLFTLAACGGNADTEPSGTSQNTLPVTQPPYSFVPSESTLPPSVSTGPSIPETTVDASFPAEPEISEADMRSYDLAVELLDRLVSGAEVNNLTILDESADTVYRGNAALDYIYKLFTRLYNYRDSAEYLERFVVIPDVILGERWITTENPEYGNTQELEEYYYYTYNSLGQLTGYWDLQMISKYALTGTYDYTGYYYTYAYDTEGHVSYILISNRYDTPTFASIILTYDDDGRVVHELLESSRTFTGVAVSNYSYTYDAHGRLESRIFQDGPENSVSSITSYTYTGDFLIQEVYEKYDDPGYVSRRKTTDYTYDETGKLSEKTVTEQMGMIYDHAGYSTTNHYSYRCGADGRILSELLTYGDTIEPDGSVQAPMDASREIMYIYGDYYIYQFDVLPVTAAYASSSLLSSPSACDAYQERASDYQVHIAFSAGSDVTDFQYFELLFNEDGSFSPGECLYTQDTLSSGRPLVITTTFAGILPDRGISFVDSSGRTHYYGITQSGEDGSITLFAL